MTAMFNQLITYIIQSIPDIGVIDVVEMIIIAVLLYYIMAWIKNTRAWSLLKGILVVLAFILIAYIFRMDTILWLANRTLDIGIIALVIIFQPELRRALEKLGQNRLFNFILSDNRKMGDDVFSDRTINEIVKAAFAMSAANTGALIVIERRTPLAEYERTGIVVDGVVTSQLILNIFEHNTPLHDGAVIVRGNRITAATCYLPLSDNMEISKEVGTRHRAGVGISEVSDSVTVIVSEENGSVSVAYNGELKRELGEATLKGELKRITEENGSSGRRRAKGRSKDAKKADK